MTRTIKPTGYYVLVEIEEVTAKSEGGIIIESLKDEKRLVEAQCVGEIIAFGNMAYKGMSNGCNSPEDWGVKVGDKVEFNSYDGKRPKAAGKDTRLRLIIDQHIIGVIE